VPVVLGGLLVIVLATGPKVRGFKLGIRRWTFKGDKIRSTTSFEGEGVAPCRKILQQLKIPAEYDRDTSSAKFTDFLANSVSLLGVYCNHRALVDVSGMIRTQVGPQNRPERGGGCIGRFVRYHLVTVTNDQ
jgi:hypothetical protein